MNADSDIATPSPMHDAGEVELLLTFVRDRDIHCPRCDYNLRNLTQPVCPECNEKLALKVGVQRVTLAPLLLAQAPGAFCAIAVGLFVTACLLEGPPPSSQWQVWVTVAFLAISGMCAVALAVCHRWFLMLSDAAQKTIALLVWVVHVLALLVFLQQV